MLTYHLPPAVELAYTDSGGAGDPVLLIHGGGLADWFAPLAAQEALSRYRVIRAVRAGYTGAPAPEGLTVADHAAHTAALLEHLGAGPAHVVAHSSGCTIALQLAADRPGLVRTLTLCEPPLVDALADPGDAPMLRAAFGPVMAAAARGDLPAAFDTFMTLVCGADYRRVVTATLGARTLDEAVDRCRSFLTGEMPAVGAWTFDPAAVRRPVLLIQGSASPPPVHRLVAHLAGRLPGATVATLAGADHLMPLTEPAGLGRLVGDFCRRHTRRLEDPDGNRLAFVTK